jgi:hypothetical protein
MRARAAGKAGRAREARARGGASATPRWRDALGGISILRAAAASLDEDFKVSWLRLGVFLMLFVPLFIGALLLFGLFNLGV